jgi:hypothetical protein
MINIFMLWSLESIFLLQQDNVICQALLVSWGESNNLYTINTLLTVPLTPFRLLAVELIMWNPSLMHTRIVGLLNSETCMTITTAKLPGLITTPHPILTAIACCLHIIMNGHPQCSLYATILMLLHVIVSLWSHLSIMMIERRSQPGALNGPEHFSQEPHHTGPNSIHDSVLEDNVSIVTNTKELFEEQR